MHEGSDGVLAFLAGAGSGEFPHLDLERRSIQQRADLCTRDRCARIVTHRAGNEPISRQGLRSWNAGLERNGGFPAGDSRYAALVTRGLHPHDSGCPAFARDGRRLRFAIPGEEKHGHTAKECEHARDPDRPAEETLPDRRVHGRGAGRRGRRPGEGRQGQAPAPAVIAVCAVEPPPEPVQAALQAGANGAGGHAEVHRDLARGSVLEETVENRGLVGLLQTENRLDDIAVNLRAADHFFR